MISSREHLDDGPQCRVGLRDAVAIGEDGARELQSERMALGGAG